MTALFTSFRQAFAPLLASFVAFGLWAPAQGAAAETCLDCHKRDTPAAVTQWQKSAHAKAKVGCEGCHGTDHTMIERGGAVVSDATCGKCHKKANETHAASKHGMSKHTGWGCTRNLPKRDEAECGFCHREDTTATVTKVQCARFLTQSTEMGQLGCNGCHKVESACSSCHTNHLTDLAIVRDPRICAKCHMGPDHPQWEMWETSMHGSLNRSIGPDHGPDCQRCHMTKTHNVSRGIASAVSGKAYKAERFKKERDTMVAVCTQCHAKKFAEKELAQGDAIREQSLAMVKEAAEIIRQLNDDGLLDPGPKDRPEHPLRGHELVLDGDMLYEDISHIERLFFSMKKFALAKTYKGAYHQNPAYTHWLGNAELKMLLVDIRSEANRLRERGGMPAGEFEEGDGQAPEARPVRTLERKDDPLQRDFRSLKRKLERGEISAKEYAAEKAKRLEALTGGVKKKTPAPEETPAPQP